MTAILREFTRAADERLLALQAWMLLDKHAAYGISASRIFVGIAMLGILVANFPQRHILWGQASFWAQPERDNSRFGWLLGVFDVESPALFTTMYLALMAVTVAVILGWRTRVMTLLLAVGMAALVERAPMVGDQGDNIARIGLTLMVLMSAAEHWSLDARRRRRAREQHDVDSFSLGRKLWYGLPVLPTWLTNPLHNVALMTLAMQIFILYTASALFKVQGELWQQGTAFYYPLSLHEYGVFPWLNELLVANAAFVTIATYVSIYVQLFFAVGLLHPVSRRLALIGILLFHGSIAVLMGLPWFSLAMLAFDAIFISTRTYERVNSALRHTGARLQERWAQKKATAAPAPEAKTAAD
ncbi:HTTM domain-containing protein [Nesterenkonia alba]|uniref:HTTM domain-containing protein n=1 Tax=Nesterenkonia alba TaxID=515814 RepID=UPI0003B43FCD|nr:HTTM domain-containing protein [Nesterenkonia alba]